MTAFLIIAPCTPPPTVLGPFRVPSPHQPPSNSYIQGLCGYNCPLSKKKKKKKAFVLGAGSVLVLITLWNLVLSLNYKNVAFPKARR